MILNCIAVDDEPLALGLVSRFIEQTPFLNLAGKFTNAIDALKALHSRDIDLIFLDIQMPDLTGIELARLQNKGAAKPRIIFTTAYNHFALEGYRVDALDYLLKPFNYEEFLRAAQKALNYAQLLQKPVTDPDLHSTEEDYLFLKVEHQLVRVEFSDILYIEALKDFVKVVLHSSDKAILSITTLKALEEKLPVNRFLRVHRSFIISLDKITSMTKRNVLIGNKHINIGDQYREAFIRFQERWI